MAEPIIKMTGCDLQNTAFRHCFKARKFELIPAPVQLHESHSYGKALEKIASDTGKRILRYRYYLARGLQRPVPKMASAPVVESLSLTEQELNSPDSFPTTCLYNVSSFEETEIPSTKEDVKVKHMLATDVNK
ncbi:Hypothetical predicted protein, partial [Pelobates cultripes]